MQAQMTTTTNAGDRCQMEGKIARAFCQKLHSAWIFHLFLGHFLFSHFFFGWGVNLKSAGALLVPQSTSKPAEPPAPAAAEFSEKKNNAGGGIESKKKTEKECWKKHAHCAEHTHTHTRRLTHAHSH